MQNNGTAGKFLAKMEFSSVTSPWRAEVDEGSTVEQRDELEKYQSQPKVLQIQDKGNSDPAHRVGTAIRRLKKQWAEQPRLPISGAHIAEYVKTSYGFCYDPPSGSMEWRV